MFFRPLGSTGLQVSALSFGAGPVSTLMVGDAIDLQQQVVSYAIGKGINWFDTAATYGAGLSEQNLGRVLQELSVADRVHVATKVRLGVDDLSDIRSAVIRSLESSLRRLRLPRVTLLQLHNSVTECRGDEPTSISPDDVLGKGGVAEVLEEMQGQGMVAHIGLTGIGDPTSLSQVVHSGRFDTMQVPYHLLNASAGQVVPSTFTETNYGNIIAACAHMDMGVFAIRVLAGGALADNPPSPHTLKTPFFPLDLYERDRKRANKLRDAVGNRPLPQEAVRFALNHPYINSAIIGFGNVRQIDDAISALESQAPVLTWNDIFTPEICHIEPNVNSHLKQSE